MPSKELEHLRRTVQAAKKIVKKPVHDYTEQEAESPNRPATERPPNRE